VTNEPGQFYFEGTIISQKINDKGKRNQEQIAKNQRLRTMMVESQQRYYTHPAHIKKENEQDIDIQFEGLVLMHKRKKISKQRSKHCYVKETNGNRFSENQGEVSEREKVNQHEIQYSFPLPFTHVRSFHI
jgi:hypothetical protein